MFAAKLVFSSFLQHEVGENYDISPFPRRAFYLLGWVNQPPQPDNLKL